MRLHILIAH